MGDVAHHVSAKDRGVMPIWLIIMVVTLLRLAYIWVNQRPLGIEEAQYWSWSTHLTWGYHSKGPLIAWLIHLSTMFNGSSLFGVRFFAPIAYAVTSFMVYFAALRLFNARVAFYAALTFLFMPAVSFSSTVMSTDPLMLMFWSIALYNLIEARETGSMRHWLLCGVAIGLGVLAKYTMGVFVISTLLFIILHERRLLKEKGLYVALVVGFLILLPNLVWNAHHQWVTFSHVSHHNADLSNAGLHFKPFLDFMGSQFAVAGPVIFLMFLLYFVQVRCVSKDSKIALLFWQIAPLFIAIVIESILSRAYANWAAPVYVAASIFVCALWLHKHQAGLLKIAIILNLILGLLFYGYELSRQYGVTQISSLVKVDPFKRNRPWPSVGRAILSIRVHHWGTKFLFDSRSILSESLYYGQIPLKQAFVFNPDMKPALQYDLSTSLKVGQQYIYIADQKDSPVLARFDSHQLINVLSMQGRHYHYQFYFYALKGFKGY